MDLNALPPDRMSWKEFLAKLDRKEQNRILDQLSAAEMEALLKDWKFLARKEQLPPPGDWMIWLILAGRGFGKTRTGAEWLVEQHRDKGCQISGIVATNFDDLKRYCIRGPSGILSVAGDFAPEPKDGLMRLIWPNGTETLCFTSQKPDRIRGPNLEKVWADEFAAWAYLEECWENIEFALRQSEEPRVAITTTPKPKRLLRKLVDDSEKPNSDTVLVKGHTFDNAGNLAERYIQRMKDEWEGTRVGRRELAAELLDDAEGALFSRQILDDNRVDLSYMPELRRSAVAVDPAQEDHEFSDEVGIIAGGVGTNGHGYVTNDWSGKYGPRETARTAIFLFFETDANFIVVEKNGGGQWIKKGIENELREMKRNREIPHMNVPIRMVNASKGKQARAEPVSTLYEQRRVHHVRFPDGNSFEKLEDELCMWEANSGQPSPNRLDACVWLWTSLLLSNEADDPLAPPQDDLDRASPWAVH
jgi:phage terminase large subunit-like protein